MMFCVVFHRCSGWNIAELQYCDMCARGGYIGNGVADRLYYIIEITRAYFTLFPAAISAAFRSLLMFVDQAEEDEMSLPAGDLVILQKQSVNTYSKVIATDRHIFNRWLIYEFSPTTCCSQCHAAHGNSRVETTVPQKLSLHEYSKQWCDVSH